jgi:DNA-binding SARP family transcriptional activator
MSERGERPDRLSIRLFGPLAIVDGPRMLGPRDLGGSRPKQVLEILLAARGHRVPSDRLAELLWGREPPRNPAGALQTFVSILRKRLGADRDRAGGFVITEARAYRLATDLVDLDLDRFDSLLERSAHEPTQQARRDLAAALALVRGDVLEDEPYAVWAQELRDTYQARVLGARLDAATSALAELDYPDALAHAEVAVGLDAFSEHARRCLMLALYGLGRQHDALAAYRAFRAQLHGELGIEPTPETRALEAAFLHQREPRLLMPRAILPRAEQAGERPGRLLGRSAELSDLDRAVREALDGAFRLIQIEGEAGFGKTRLLDELASALVGVRVGRASCARLEAHLPYVPLAAALRDALAGIDLDARQLPALRRVLPELAHDAPAKPPAEIDALEALVEVVTEHAPLVLLLDDAHWADRETLSALSYLQRRCARDAAAFVVALRTRSVPDDAVISPLQPDIVVRLAPLTAADLEPLGIPAIHEATGGIPRFVTSVSTDPHGPTAVAETLLRRCRAEGAYAYRVLLAASVLHQPFDPQSLALLLRADAAELIEELERLCTRRILMVAGYNFQFRYQLMHAVLRASLSPARRRLLRARLDPPELAVRASRPTPVLRRMKG